jgi:hypothetical protein
MRSMNGNEAEGGHQMHSLLRSQPVVCDVRCTSGQKCFIPVRIMQGFVQVNKAKIVTSTLSYNPSKSFMEAFSRLTAVWKGFMVRVLLLHVQRTAMFFNRS